MLLLLLGMAAARFKVPELEAPTAQQYILILDILFINDD